MVNNIITLNEYITLILYCIRVDKNINSNTIENYKKEKEKEGISSTKKEMPYKYSADDEINLVSINSFHNKLKFEIDTKEKTTFFGPMLNFKNMIADHNNTKEIWYKIFPQETNSIVCMRANYKATFLQKMDYSWFPFDVQNLTMV